MPRKRAGRLPTALIKAFLPAPTTRKRSRRKRPPAIALPKALSVPAAARTAARSLPKIVPPPPGRPASGKTVARTPASRKPTSRASSARSTGSGKRPRRPAAPTPSSIGRGTWRQARFTGVAGTRSYRVYIPHGLRRTTKAPLVLALHGCGQNGMDFAAGTRFSDVADKHQFVVVYPEQAVTHNGQRCWNWFRPTHQSRAQGEPAILAGIVRRVIRETAAWRIDPDRIYVTGISAGGGMAVVLAATYPELFAAVGVHSAPPYRSASGPANALAAMQGRAAPAQVEAAATAAMPPMIIFQGTFDGTVRPVNGQRVADQWLSYHRHSAPAASRAKGVVIGDPRVTHASPARPATARSRRGYTVSRWYAGGRKVLELWVVEGLGHAWSGGSSKGSYSDSRGPRATTEMWRFFSAHRSATAAAVIKAG